MTQGVFLYGSRPKTKKQLRQAIAEINQNLSRSKDEPKQGADGYSVVIEATSLFGNEFDGSLNQALREDPPNHGPFYLVGPDPRTSRKWYANLRFDPDPGNPENSGSPTSSLTSSPTNSPEKGKWILK